VLVLCAEIGEGHVTVARALASDLSAREDVDAVQLRTDLEVLGPRLGRFLTNGFHIHLDQIGWSYELAYRIFFGLASARQASQFALAVLGGRGLRRTIAAFGPDVVVTEYPVLSAALGQLRALGRLAVPICSSISDPAGLYYWAHPGIDLHLLSWPESLAEAEQIAGPGRAVAVRPLIDRRFLHPPSRASARSVLDLPQEATVVLVSGGGWALEDLQGAAEAALAALPEAIVICLAGRSSRTRTSLLGAFGDDRRVRVLGFTDRMPELLAASDVLVHTTGGTTALEARVVGCPLINFGSGVAHVRAHARALAEWGVAEWARDRAALGPALARTLARSRPASLAIDALPNAAELVAEVGRGAHASAPSSST
jgi:UDP-N-acetylglucosamine:LPS N-acetylglucosamine transferase